MTKTKKGYIGQGSTHWKMQDGFKSNRVRRVWERPGGIEQDLLLKVKFRKCRKQANMPRTKKS